jgi:release factor glutamine methyltransferase
VRKNLKDIYHIQKVLKSNAYFDLSRISKEILEYCEENDIKLPTVLERIESGEPWEYIRGVSSFYGYDFLVDRNTLIPRVETEELVSIVLDLLSKNPPFKHVIDVGTGSGCIIISIAKNLRKEKDIKFTGVDISEKALKTAKRNALLHKVNKKVSFLKGNLLEHLNIDSPTLVIANLPYIPTDMYNKLDRSVKEFEPGQALDGGEDGLKYYKELLEQLKKIEVEGKKLTLVIEVEPSTLGNVKQLFNNYKYQILSDFRGLNRFVLIHLS